MIKIGNWKYVKGNKTFRFKSKSYDYEYVKGNKTFRFKSKSYDYEVDCERMSTNDWIQHISETKTSVMSQKDISDLSNCFQQLKKENPNLPVFTNKDNYR